MLESGYKILKQKKKLYCIQENEERVTSHIRTQYSFFFPSVVYKVTETMKKKLYSIRTPASLSGLSSGSLSSK